jgi:metallophosphoesterase superfamily enzyme
LDTLSTISAWAIAVCGFACVLGLSLGAVLWVWASLIGRRKDWRALLLLTSKAMYGKDYNRRLVLPALEDYISGSDLTAYQVIEFLRKKYPNAETVWDDEEEIE